MSTQPSSQGLLYGKSAESLVSLQDLTNLRTDDWRKDESRCCAFLRRMMDYVHCMRCAVSIRLQIFADKRPDPTARRLKAIRLLRRWWLMPIYRSCILATGNLRLLQIPRRSAAAAAARSLYDRLMCILYKRCLSVVPPLDKTEIRNNGLLFRIW